MMNQGLDVKNGFRVKPVYVTNGRAMNKVLTADQWEAGTPEHCGGRLPEAKGLTSQTTRIK